MDPQDQFQPTNPETQKRATVTTPDIDAVRARIADITGSVAPTATGVVKGHDQAPQPASPEVDPIDRIARLILDAAKMAIVATSHQDVTLAA